MRSQDCHHQIDTFTVCGCFNALCSGALQVRFMYAGYTPVIRDKPREYNAILLLLGRLVC